MIETADRSLFNDDHHAFRDTVRRVLSDVIAPRMDAHEKDGIVEREAWQAVGAAGLLCPQVPEAYGGPGLDFSFNAIVGEELSYLGSAAGFTLQSDIVADYIVHYGSEDQKRRYLPGMVDGSTITAIAMTEPGAGSDLQGMKSIARADGNGWALSGSKTYITNGQAADLVIVCARTTEEGGAKGISLFLVEAGDDGFSRGRNLDKIGLHGNDTSELFFDAVKLPADRLLGAENGGFGMLMNQLPQERLSIAVQCQASAQRAFDEAVKFTTDRKAFGKRILDFQNTRFTLADLKARLQVGWAHLDWAIARHVAGRLTPAEASAAKLWHKRDAVGRVRYRAAAARRRRLHERISHRPAVARRPGCAHLRRYVGNYEGADWPKHRHRRISVDAGDSAAWPPRASKGGRHVHRAQAPPISR